ncbi:MAG TPA: beta-L-arabinofuranosidase domain-containing protein [Paludibacter sp.]|nr:beta-L-arabinofuranosidase domain-containing protein [Paludibacter sp.]
MNIQLKMMIKNILWGILFFSVSALNAQNICGWENQFLDKGKRPIVFSTKDVVLSESWIKQREAVNARYIYQFDPDRLLHNFRINAGIESKAQPLGGWESPGVGLRGHFVGHYLSACALLIEKTGDTLLQKRVKYMVDVLADCQQKLGGKYLSAFPENDFTTLETQFGGVWAPYYTYHKIMQGMLDVYKATGNKKAYAIVVNMATYVKERMDKLSPESIEKMLYTPQANPANEAGGMNDVLNDLFAISKDSVHYKLACLFDRKWFSQPLYEGKDILSGLHSNTHLPLIIGFAKRYENTGDSYYRDVVSHFWDILTKHHCYVNGSSSGPRPIGSTSTAQTSEHWGNPDHLSATLTDKTSESCVSHNTQKITSALFRWTAQPEYAEVYMNTLYNSVFALQNAETGCNVYSLPLGSPNKKSFAKPSEFFCCNGTTIEAFTGLNTNIYFYNNNNLWVNLYIPSSVNWKSKGISLSQSSDFPDSSVVKFNVTAKKSTSFALKLFIPSWADEQTQVMVNGQPIKEGIKPMSYVTIDRKWKSGDKIEVRFNYHFQVKSMPDNPHVIALFYGPVLLAFQVNEEVILKGNDADILKNISKQGNSMTFTLKNNGKEYTLVPFYKVANVSYGVYATIRNEY